MGFTDLLTSSRGPGVIGTLLALLILVGFGTLYVFVFDEGLQGGGQTIEGYIREQGEEIENLKIGIKNGKQRIEDARALKEVADEADALAIRAEISAKRIEELSAAKAEAEAAAEAADEDWRKYQAEYRASEWAAAEGEKIGDLKTISGDSYRAAVITSVDHMGMRISSPDGVLNIKPDELPRELYDRFQFSEELTKSAKDKLASETEVHETNVEIVQRAKKAQDKLKQIDDLKATNERMTRQIREAKASLPRRQADVTRQRIAVANERQKTGGVSRAPAMQAKLKEMERSLSEYRRKIPAGEREVTANKRKIGFLEREVDILRDEIAEIKKINEAKEAAEAGQAAAQP